MKKIFTLLLLSSTLFIAHAQIITTVAGNGTPGYSGNGGAAVQAQLNTPYCVSFDVNGNMFIADFYNNSIRKVDINGIITTVAGNGTQGFSGDGAAATSAQLNRPTGVAVDAAGNIFIADYNNQRIRKVDFNGIITTIAGTGVIGFSGDGGSATAAQFHNPVDIALDNSGNIYISDNLNHCIRKINAGGVISTFAGIGGGQGYFGDGGLATAATMDHPYGIFMDASGNLLITDAGNARIRNVNSSGIISTVAGNGSFGFSGDGGLATSAQLATALDVTEDAFGNMYIADYGNQRIRKVAAGIITTVAGNGTQGYNGDGGAATDAQLNYPVSIATTANGDFFIADEFNHRIRKVTVPPGLPSISITDKSVTEGNSGTTLMKLKVTLSSASTSTVTVNYATADSTATAGSDYVAKNGKVKFNAGQTSKTISVTINGDTQFEPTEKLKVLLSVPVNATIADGLGVGTIKNDDVAAIAANIAISDAAVATNITLKVSPNPAKDLVTISGLLAGKTNFIELTDLSGRSLLKQKVSANTQTISIAKYASGIYLLRYYDGSKWQQLKVVKE